MDILSKSVIPLKNKSPSATKLTGRFFQAPIDLEGVSVAFGAAANQKIILDSMTAHIEPGEFVALLGPSGCGKSTVLNLVAGYLKPTSGAVVVNGSPVDGPDPQRGMVFQQHSLFPWKTVQENVEFGPRMAGEPKTIAESTARTFLGMVGLGKFANHYPSQLSGGMQHRVEIARALANYPGVLLMDEPFGALDAQTRLVMQDGLLKLWEQFKPTVLFVTHDIDEAVLLADRILIMGVSPGRVIAELDVTIERPRNVRAITDQRFARLKAQCLELLEHESRKAFGADDSEEAEAGVA
ncbi:MAG: ABC transporter ATP-binding protein [Gammaproteobacteria bacterium]